jgi:hypothetical protein
MAADPRADVDQTDSIEHQDATDGGLRCADVAQVNRTEIIEETHDSYGCRQAAEKDEAYDRAVEYESQEAILSFQAG